MLLTARDSLSSIQCQRHDFYSNDAERQLSPDATMIIIFWIRAVDYYCTGALQDEHSIRCFSYVFYSLLLPWSSSWRLTMSNSWARSPSLCCSPATPASSTERCESAFPKSAWFGLSSSWVLKEGSYSLSELEDPHASHRRFRNPPSLSSKPATSRVC